MDKQAVKELLKEPSTYAGIAAIIVAAFGFDAFSPEQIGTALAGIAAVFLKEKSK